MSDRRPKTVARIYEKGSDVPMLEAYVYDDVDDPFGQRVRFTDEAIAKRLGLIHARIPYKDVSFGVEDGLHYVKNLWRMFGDSPGILADRPVDTTRLMSIPETMQPRKSRRGEPSMDEIEDVEGVYRRYQERKETP